MSKEKISKKAQPFSLVLIFILVLVAVFRALNTDDGAVVNPGVSAAAGSDYPLSVSFVDVGQGDGVVIINGDTVVVIDGGERDKANAVISTLRSGGVSKIDCYVASHPHADHIGGADRIFEAFEVKAFMTTAFSEINIPTTNTYERMMNAAAAEEDCDILFVRAGESYTFGNLRFDVFSPVEETTDYNNMSIVLKMTYGKTSFLFTGDAEKESEKLMLEQGFDLKSDVLKLGHHGSSTSTTEDFFAAVFPRLAVISCGRNNEYGHPHKETLALLNRTQTEFHRTDEEGAVVVFSDGKDIFVKE